MFWYIVATLWKQKEATMKFAFAHGTFKNLKVQWKTFQQFCEEVDGISFPVDIVSLLLYMQYLSNKMKSPQTVTNYVNGLRVLHALYNLDTSMFYSLEAKLLSRAIKRSKLHRVKQAEPISIGILDRMSRVVDVTDPKERVMWCAILVMFFCMLRSSNLVPKSKTSFDPDKQLCKSDIIKGQDVMVVSIRWSKVIQFAQRHYHIPLLSIPGSLLCPIQAIYDVLELSKASKSTALFVIPSGKSKFVHLTYPKLSGQLKKWVKLIGLNSKKFSLHSLRRGSATLAFASQVPGELIKAQGDWSSDAYIRYLDISVQQRCQVAEKIKASVLNAINLN